MRKQIGTATGVVVESLPLTDIHPAPWNVRTGHDIDGIVESIRVNGFRDPIEVWGFTGEIVAGEGRYHAAKALGMETVPVIRHTFDSLASAKRYAIANNRLTDKSAFDLPALAAQLNDLPDLDGTGFSASDLAELEANMLEPEESAWEGAMGRLPQGDQGELSTMTFTLAREQVDVVNAAITRAKTVARFVNTGNENTNGNALARIAEAYVNVG